MERFSALLLDVWREVCRHIEIGESVGRVAPILMRRVPLEVVLVRRIDSQRGHIETVATGICRGTPLALRPKNDCPAEAMERIRLWAETKEVICGRGASAAALARCAA
jgi:hydrogenase-4 transcriptional activator